MDLSTFIVAVFCLVDDRIKSHRRIIRQRGPFPTLSDSEVLTIEIVGAYAEELADKGIYPLAGKVIAGTRCPYGFGYNDARDNYVVDPERMTVVRRIFEMVGGRS